MKKKQSQRIYVSLLCLLIKNINSFLVRQRSDNL